MEYIDKFGLQEDPLFTFTQNSLILNRLYNFRRESKSAQFKLLILKGLIEGSIRVWNRKRSIKTYGLDSIKVSGGCP